MNSTRFQAELIAMVICAVPAAAQRAADASHQPGQAPLAVVRDAVLPRAITSFGACTTGGHVWVFGGHVGREHAHSRENVVGDFQRLNLTDGTWQALPDGPALQGTALVAGPDGALFRIGGLSARNAQGDDADLHSTASVERFDSRTQKWSEAMPLPEPRSSHDAVVVGQHVFVAGGWTLAGEGNGTWLETAWMADLSATPLQWQPLPGPGHRRAAALAAFGDRVVLLGGMDPDGMTTSVRIYDPQAQQWSDGPALPGGAFGTAAIAVGGRLLATVMDGRVLAWDGKGEWQRVASLETPRFFHRLVPTTNPGEILAIGGAGRGGHMRTMERVQLDPAAGPVLREVVLPAPGRVTQRQALLMVGNTLWAFGGNRGTSKERFAADQFADDIWRVDLLAQTADRVSALPNGCQSMAATVYGDKLGNIVLGGIGLGADGKIGSLTATFRWDPQATALRPFASLPAPRTQCQVVQHDGALYVLGGTDFRPDADGGTETALGTEVLRCELRAPEPAFTEASFQLPRPRRSFGAAVLGGALLVVGGLAEGFEAVATMDVFDFKSGTWITVELPTPWVSPQVAVIGDRLWVACGGTMQGQKFTEDRALWSWSAVEGWRCGFAELPFAVRNVQLRALRNRLLFYGVDGERIVIRTLLPDAAVDVHESAMHR